MKPLFPTLARRIAFAVILPLAACSNENPESLLASARAYIEQKDDRAAIIQIKNALQERPDYPEARFLLGKTLLQTGDAAAAEVELRRAMKLGHPSDETVPLLARALLQSRQQAKLLAEFGNFQGNSPDSSASVYTSLGIAHDMQGNRSAAQSAIAKALSAKADFSPALLVRARLLGADGKIADALALVDSVIASKADDGGAYKLRGDLLVARGDTDSALAAYRSAVEANPDQIGARAALVSILVGQRKLDEAKQQITQLRKLSPGHPMGSHLEARVALAQNDLAAARDHAQAALKAAPDDSSTLYLAGLIEYQAQAFAQAEVYLTRLLRLHPDALGAHRLLAITYLRSNQPHRSLQVLNPLLAKEGKDAELLALAGEAAMQLGEFADAERYFQSASALDPTDVKKQTALALLRVSRGNEIGFADLERIAAADGDMRADLALIAASVERRQHDRALKAIAALEAKRPNDPRTHYLRGAVLFDRQDGAAARRSLTRALEIDPGYLPAALSLAKLDLLDGKPDAARQRFDPVLKQDGKNLAALMALAEVETRAGSSSDTVAALLSRAVSADPDAPGPRLLLVELHLRNREPAKALTVAQQAVAASANKPEYLDALGRAQLAAGENQNALASFSRLADAQPNSPLPLLRIAESHLADKNFDRAIAELEKALAIKADFVEAQRLLAEIYGSRGAIEQAVTIARKVQQQRPREDAGYLLEGRVRTLSKDWPAAATVYRNGLAKAPSSDLAIRLHGALLAGGSVAEAKRLADSWAAEHPRDARFRMYLGDQAIGAGKPDVAAAHYRRVVELQPNNAVALNNLAWVAQQGKDPAALRYAEQANRMAPGNPAFMDTLAMVLLERGESARAVALLREATAKAPQAVQIRVNLARALARSGDRSGAQREYEFLSNLGDRGPGKDALDKLRAEI
jgi:putative PEP-CTERM system TPR-repeat lipoprotein